MGPPAKQWKIVGNSVARPVALALGMALRKAWLSNLETLVPSASDDSVVNTIIVPIQADTIEPALDGSENVSPFQYRRFLEDSVTPELSTKSGSLKRPIGQQGVLQSTKRLRPNAHPSTSPSGRPSLSSTPTSDRTMSLHLDINISHNSTTLTSMNGSRGKTPLVDSFSSGEEEEEAWNTMTTAAGTVSFMEN